MVPEGKVSRARVALVAGWLACAGLLVACGGAGDQAPSVAPALDPVFLADQQAWRQQREQDLLRPDGWTSLAGLH